MWIESHPLPWDDRTKMEYQNEIRARIDSWLDKSYGECILSTPENRRIVSDALLFFNNIKYHLYSFVIMPNHVHVLLSPINSYKVIKEIGKVKSFTSKQINKRLGREGAVWQREIFDRLVRSENHFNAYDDYIMNNPVGMNPNSFTLYHI